jgi:hypothetical protein
MKQGRSYYCKSFLSGSGPVSNSASQGLRCLRPRRQLDRLTDSGILMRMSGRCLLLLILLAAMVASIVRIGHESLGWGSYSYLDIVLPWQR